MALSYSKNELGADHSIEFYQIQQQMPKAVAAPMVAKIRAARRPEVAAKVEVAAVLLWTEEYAANIISHPRTSPFTSL